MGVNQSNSVRDRWYSKITLKPKPTLNCECNEDDDTKDEVGHHARRNRLKPILASFTSNILQDSTSHSTQTCTPQQVRDELNVFQQLARTSALLYTPLQTAATLIDRAASLTAARLPFSKDSSSICDMFHLKRLVNAYSPRQFMLYQAGHNRDASTDQCA